MPQLENENVSARIDCLAQPSAYRLTIYRTANIMWLKYRYRIFFENITQYFIMYYWSILAFHGPVKAKRLFKYPMV